MEEYRVATAREAGERHGAAAGTHQTEKFQTRHDHNDLRIGAQHVHGFTGLMNSELESGLFAFFEGARVGELYMAEAVANGVVAQAVERLRHE